MSYDSVNPYTGELMKHFDEHSDEAMEDALSRADACFRSFGTVEARAEVLRKAAALMRERREDLARMITLEMGKLIRESRDEVELSASILDYYAEKAPKLLARRPLEESTVGEAWLELEPIGVLIGVEPWNYPFYQLVRFVGPNIAAGNTILMKHAPGVPQCAVAFEKVMQDAGAPDGAYINLFLSNDQVSRLIADPRIQGVALTGSERAGESLAAQAGKALKKSTMELGGNDAFIVMEDFDPRLAARMAAQGRMGNCGQVCVGSKRFIVVDKIADEFLAELMRLMAQYIPGNPMDESTTLGPLSSSLALDRLVEQLDIALRHGATLLMGGSRPAGPGAFLSPTILTDIDRSNPAYSQEFFGPVAMFFRAKDEDEAMKIANDSPFGLGGAICTSDPRRARRLASRLQSGMVFINYPALTAPELPFGGIKRSGYGRELSGLGIEEFVNKKMVCMVDPAKVRHSVS
ncbi:MULTISPECIES: NAD-dependent succinate-semialdehyde dehydrogenase [Acidobacterium]|uniref:Aldehyde dehydrogenase (NAD) family protein n=1 Tax=Acidobacterium capsulatum (strain ATCC 51196 / DSM 11244 / BCRC 80197 / JCM 7670 / NBRC 15755 / NCIMB 13165 / 161) TaxID=240015 RepID=C1F5E8_ACIC5|nr:MULTISPECIES: NAD-dependent succinate-semialdehyde dehydrogenase [Acidobacterium]ACO34664.1 aldehyde dehydrogenase (NAD) family protein [Acidobacterium capsulatum ATCC 51196]HCT60836.1 NAD-dependent succinate-semialdehyde dehydrogenase [Acidobacterium sp.]